MSKKDGKKKEDVFEVVVQKKDFKNVGATCNYVGAELRRLAALHLVKLPRDCQYKFSLLKTEWKPDTVSFSYSACVGPVVLPMSSTRAELGMPGHGIIRDKI